MENRKKEENKKDKLKQMRRRLYRKDFKAEPIVSGRFKKKKYDVKEGWENPSVESVETETEESKKISKKKMSLVKKIFIFSAAFFVVALGFVIFTFYRGSNILSVENIDINTTGPVSVKGGEEFEIKFDIKNRSEAAMESASLLVEYPEGVYSSFDSQDEMTRTREDLGVIEPGDSVSKTIPLALFGEENSEKKIDFITYNGHKGSYKVRISSSPVNLSFSLPKEASLKQEFEMKIDLESNSNNTMKGLLLRAEYPSSFVFKGASPKPISGDNIWDIGDLGATDKRTITIRGVLEGQQGDEKVFRVATGKRVKTNKNIIGTVYNFISESIVLTKPFLGVNLLVNGDSSPEYIAKAGKPIRVDILWESNIPTRIIDGQIKIKLDGDILDKFSVLAGSGGFYRSVDNTIIWDKNSNPELSVVEPGEKGSVGFTFQSLPLVKSNGRIFKNPQIVINASANGKRISDINVPEEVTTSVDKKIKIESGLAITSRPVYFTGPFKNTGPIPPVAEKETTYTIIWTIMNSSNNVSDVIVKTTLPTYVKWVGVTSPGNENISFNNAGGEVVWDVGNVERGAGVTSSAREVAFQVSFLPSVSQVNKSPQLSGEVVLTGTDTFTGTVIIDKVKGFSTNLSTDPYFNVRQSIVTY